MLNAGSSEIAEHVVHVWSLNVKGAADVASEFEPLLASDERTRAQRFRFEHLRHRFVITRGVLRLLLGRYLGMHPGYVRFQYGSKGKPSLASGSKLEFSIAHSGDVAAFAFTQGCRIGIDIEQIRALEDAPAIAARFFCREEAEEIMALPPSQRELAFFVCWTRKEAFIKATGDGLSLPLDDFRVTLQPGVPARLIHAARDAKAAEAWTMHGLTLAPGYAGAIAYCDSQRSVSVFPTVDPGQFIPCV